MKNLSLYLSLAIAGLFTTACHEDFDDWSKPQSFAEPTAISIPGFTASPVAADIDLNSDEENVKVLSFNNASFFGKYVKEHFGQTPMQIRMNNA